jgi:hypothetical protein
MAYTPEIGTTFWREVDRATQYDEAFMSMIGAAGAFRIQEDYKNSRTDSTYPAVFLQKFQARRDSWARIADVQTRNIANLLGTDWSDIQAAFEDFGQGTLLDDDPQRRADNNSIHMMDGQDDNPPVGYHRWHASIRLIQLLNIGDAGWWESLDRVLGLAWGIQSFARPRQQNMANPRLAQRDLQELRDAWLALTPDRRDRQYDHLPGSSGYHPSPKQPV